MWPSETLLRVLIICTMSCIYLLRRAQWEDQLKSLMSLQPKLSQSRRVQVTLWLLLSICFFLVLRTFRVHFMQIYNRRESNMEEMEIYLNLQHTEPMPMPGIDAAKWAARIEQHKPLKIASTSADANESNNQQPNSIQPAVAQSSD